jgi:hypothetical protein
VQHTGKHAALERIFEAASCRARRGSRCPPRVVRTAMARRCVCRRGLRGSRRRVWNARSSAWRSEPPRRRSSSPEATTCSLRPRFLMIRCLARPCSRTLSTR